MDQKGEKGRYIPSFQLPSLQQSLAQVVALEMTQGVDIEEQLQGLQSLVAYVRVEIQRGLSGAQEGGIYLAGGVPIFSSLIDWIRYFSQHFELGVIEDYAAERLGQMATDVHSVQRVEDDSKDENDLLVASKIKNIPSAMQARMCGEAWKILKDFSLSTLVNKAIFEAHINESFALLESGAEGHGHNYFSDVPDFHEGGGPVDFEDLTLWMAYYMKGYERKDIQALLMHVFNAHQLESFEEMIENNIEVDSEDWDLLVESYPELDGKFDEFDAALYALVADDLEESARELSIEHERIIKPHHLYRVSVNLHPQDSNMICCEISYMVPSKNKKKKEEDWGCSMTESRTIHHILKKMGIEVTPQDEIARLGSWLMRGATPEA